MSSSAFTPSTTTVTNNVPVNVPVVTAWEAYTPVFSGVTATGSVYYRRVGDSIEVEGLVDCTASAGTTFKIGLPTGLTIDATKVSGNNKNILGQITVSNGAGGAGVFTSGPSGLILTDSSDTSAVFVATLNATDASGNVTGTNVTGSGLFNATTQGTFKFTAPIANWAGSGTTTLATRAVEEYASNSGAEGAAANTQYSNTSYVVYGPNGSLIPNINSVTSNAATDYLVRFQQAILPTDTINLEIQQAGSGSWIPVYGGVGGVGMVTYQRQATSYYGLGFNRVTGSNTDIYVTFGNYGARPGGASATFGSLGDPWSSFTAYRWRLRKVSSGAQVGYPVSARNIVGDTSGSVVPVGMIGEQISANGTVTASTSSQTIITTATLTAGTWLISAIDASGGSATQTGADIYLFTKGANTSTEGVDKLYMRYGAGNATSVSFASRIINVAPTDSDKTVLIKVQAITAGASHSAHIVAIRIA